jgi:thioredoxin-dependent peroxiredoxin
MSHRLENTKVPEVTFKTRVRDESVEGPNPFRWQDLTSSELFGGKKVVLFGLPGAFTPTCSSTHAPGYDAQADAFKEYGVDQIVCLSVNDAFVMYKWSLDLGTKNVFMLPDGNLDFTRGIGMNVQKQNLGFGERSWRYSMLVEDGVITKVFEEAGFGDNADGDPFEVSDADTMLAYLQDNK